VDQERAQLEQMLDEGCPLQEIEQRIAALPVTKDAKAALWLRVCLRIRARRESEEGWKYRQLGGEEWVVR
jgi:hypothetical protein